MSEGNSSPAQDPFAPPYNPKLLVGELEADDGDYVVLVLQLFLLNFVILFNVSIVEQVLRGPEAFSSRHER